MDISNEQQKKIIIDRILKAAATMKKHKSHARHVFNYLEKVHGISVVFNDDDTSSKMSDGRKSSNTTTGGKHSTISKNSDFTEGMKKGTSSCLTDK